MFNRVLRTGVLVCLFAASVAAQPAAPRAVGEKLNKLGVRTFSVSPEGKPSVALYGELGDRVGSVRIDDIRGRDFDARFESSSESVSLRWHPNEKFVVLVDSTGMEHRIDFDGLVANPDMHSVALLAFRSHSSSLKLLLETVSELDSRGLLDRGVDKGLRMQTLNSYYQPSYPIESDPSDPWDSYWNSDPWMGSGGGGGPACNGPEVRGNAYGEMSRSIICEYARRDMNLKCWNRYCTGCCREYGCDAYCILDDYLCVVAGVSGQSCSSF